MYIKMMGAENAPDENSCKTYRLIQQVVDVQFGRNDTNRSPFADLIFEDGARLNVPITGNVYVLNDQGKTIGSFTP